MQFTEFNLNKSLVNQLVQTDDSPFDNAQRMDCLYYFMVDGQIICRQGRAVCVDDLSHNRQDDMHPIILKDNITRYFYLGFNNRYQHVFVVVINELNDLKIDDIKAIGLRDISDSKQDSADTVSILAYATHLNYWLQFHSFCSRCGNRLEVHRNGHMQYCPNDKREFYPRINPAVIVQISHGDKLFLARQPHWPEKRFSVAAGFVEPGETFEQTVLREIKEETDLDLVDIEYLASQPWAFPNAIMIGFTAKATHLNFNVENDELSEAIWLTAEEIIEQVKQDIIALPTDISISYHLIDDWIIKQTGQSLQNHLN